MHQRAVNGWRRLAAGGVDYGIVVAYLAVLTLAGALLRAAGLLPDHITSPGGRILAQLVVIDVLTFPVTLWFAWWEAAPRGATPGKRLLGFRVSRLDGGGVSGSGSMLRSAV
ncbi:MAG: RDD family protein [Actinomycetota bacterium]